MGSFVSSSYFMTVSVGFFWLTNVTMFGLYASSSISFRSALSMYSVSPAFGGVISFMLYIDSSRSYMVISPAAPWLPVMNGPLRESPSVFFTSNAAPSSGWPFESSFTMVRLGFLRFVTVTVFSWLSAATITSFGVGSRI